MYTYVHIALLGQNSWVFFIDNNMVFWSFVRKILLEDRPETDVYLVAYFTGNKWISKSEYADFN